LILLGFLAASLATTTRTESNIARNVVDNAEAEALADAGIHRAVAGLAISIDNGGFRVDGTVYRWIYGDAEIRFDIRDEGGKIDLNEAPETLLADLFRSTGLDDDASAALADAVADFRDDDDDRRPNGAEARDYRAAGLAGGPKDGPFELVDELLYVYGMTYDVFLRVRAAVTVYSGTDQVEADLAPPEVLAALVLAEKDALSSLDDDETHTGRSTATSRRLGDPNANLSQSPATRSALGRLQGKLVPLPPSLSILAEGFSERRSDAEVYTVHAEARTASGAVFVREAVVDMNAEAGDQPFGFWNWRQGQRRLFPLTTAP
jgi:general secretion pathway protein K